MLNKGNGDGRAERRTTSNKRKTNAMIKLIEPVAWMYEHHEFGRQIYAARYDADTGGTSDDWIGWAETPLYTAAAINEAAHQWQDIATAPSKCCIDVWVTLSGGYRLAECYYDTICGQWRTSRPSGQLICIPERHVSHWMPLPSPPAIEAKESQHG